MPSVPPGGDNARGKARRIAALAHLWDAGASRWPSRWRARSRPSPRTDRRQACWRCPIRPGCGRARRAGPRKGPAPRRTCRSPPLKNEQRNGENDDIRQLLINILRDGAGRSGGHEQDHEARGDHAEREGDGDPGEHHDQGGRAVCDPHRRRIETRDERRGRPVPDEERIKNRQRGHECEHRLFAHLHRKLDGKHRHTEGHQAIGDIKRWPPSRTPKSAPRTKPQ